ncbi:unnamed protein product [Pleuronectes platessa]|uniref:Uncharacterized protein n=1 Tax=Pleuronectes platessa TaxID=8262 RepID=A0A9N7UJM5_PLEPL|nr:unnamed protein product [Pleuronectes platessa]
MSRGSSDQAGVSIHQQNHQPGCRSQSRHHLNQQLSLREEVFTGGGSKLFRIDEELSRGGGHSHTFSWKWTPVTQQMDAQCVDTRGCLWEKFTGLHVVPQLNPVYLPSAISHSLVLDFRAGSASPQTTHSKKPVQSAAGLRGKCCLEPKQTSQ